MRKVNPADVRAEFVSEADEIIAHFDRVAAAVEARPSAMQDISRLASNSFLALFVSFERFISNLFLAYLNRDFTVYQRDLESRLGTSIKEKFGDGVHSMVSVQAKRHVKVADLEAIIDREGRNLTFATTDKLKSAAGGWLAPAHAGRIASITPYEARLIDTARAIRDFIAHRSEAARKNMNEMLASISAGGHNAGLGRGANDVQAVGPYLKAVAGTKRRIHLYADGLKAISSHI